MAQTNSLTEKEGRITSGVGFAKAAKNSKAAGRYFWFQLSYTLSKNVSFATEFENLAYKQPGFYTALPDDLNERNAVDNNFSLLFKYHLLPALPLKIAVASGWTYTLKTSEYYILSSNGTTQTTSRHVSFMDDYAIPMLLELEYPFWKAVNVHARAKYNLNRQYGSNYSSGIGLSVKL